MSEQLRVNPTACTGHGLCAELLPERVILDEWGYPVISAEPVPASLRKAARPPAGHRLPRPRPHAHRLPGQPQSSRSARS